jgi:hypothetical protein
VAANFARILLFLLLLHSVALCCIIFSRFLSPVLAAAFHHVRENLDDLDGTANETDLVFLKGLLDNPAVKQMIKVRTSTLAASMTSGSLLGRSDPISLAPHRFHIKDDRKSITEEVTSQLREI